MSSLGLCRLTSAQPLMGSIIHEFSINKAQWVLEGSVFGTIVVLVHLEAFPYSGE